MKTKISYFILFHFLLHLLKGSCLLINLDKPKISWCQRLRKQNKWRHQWKSLPRYFSRVVEYHTKCLQHLTRFFYVYLMRVLQNYAWNLNFRHFELHKYSQDRTDNPAHLTAIFLNILVISQHWFAIYFCNPLIW
jgi:hypothetical protein